MGHRNPLVEAFIDPDKYDVLLYLAPDVEWVPDGQRLNGDQNRREALHRRLWNMYEEFGFKDKIQLIQGNYNDRLTRAIEIVDGLLQLHVN